MRQEASAQTIAGYRARHAHTSWSWRLASTDLVNALRCDPGASRLPDTVAVNDLPSVGWRRPLGLPDRLGPYRLVRRLGAGGMGQVYEAVDATRGERVALKTIASGGSANFEALKREFRVAADIHHRNLIDLFELMEVDGLVFFTMELCRGTDFVAHVRGGPERERDDRLRALVPQLLEAVDQLHLTGVVHGDLKPANVLVEPDGRLVVLDFGVARSVLDRTAGVAWAGTPHYMSPEQLRGEVAGFASDRFAVGMILYEALTGTLPFVEDPWKILADEREVRRRPSAIARDVPADLDALCLALLALDPGARRPPPAFATRRSVDFRPAGSDAPLVGRRHEWQRLEGLVQDARRRGPRLVHLVGPSGIGRSTLLETFFATRAADDVLVLSGRCREWESVPYKGLDAVVAALATFLRRLAPLSRVRLIDAQTAPAAVLFPSLRGLMPASAVAPPARDPLEQRAAGARALKRLLSRLAEETPIVIVLDDVQWGDADSARLLAEILGPPAAPRILVLTSQRSGTPGAFMSELLALRAVHGPVFEEETLPLAPLLRGEAIALAAHLLGERATETLCARIADESGGVPLFVEELARLHLESSDGALTPPELSMDALVCARVRRLPAEAQRLLEVVAVSGRLPSQDLAFALAGLEGGSRGLLSLLRAASLVRTAGPRVSDALEAYHDRVRDSVYASLTTERRRELHHAVAGALETRDAEPDVLKFHFLRAGERDRAHGYAVRAGERAFAALAFDRAAEHFGDAVATLPSPVDAAAESTLREQLGLALFNAGRSAAAAPQFLAAAATAERRRSLELKREAVAGYLVGGRVDDGLLHLLPLMREVGVAYPASTTRAALSILRLLVPLWLARGSSDGRKGQPGDDFRADLCWTAAQSLSMVFPVEGIALHLRSLTLARRLGDPLRLGRSAIMVGAVLVNIGGPLARLGESLLAQAEQLSERHRDPYLTGLLLVFRGFCELSGDGRLALAEEQAQRGLQLLERHCTGVAWERDMARGVIWKAHEPAGDLTALGAEAAEWMRDAVERGDLYSQAMATWGVSLHRLGSGDPHSARLQMREVMTRWSRGGYTVQHFHATRMEALCHLYQGRADEAEARFSAERAQMRRIGLNRLALSRIEMDALDALIQLHVALARPGAAAPLRAARAIAARMAGERRLDGRAHAAMLRAWLATFAGESRARVDAAWAACRADYERAGMTLCARVAAWRHAELRGDEAAGAAEVAWLRERGVVDPERWAAIVVPPLPAPARAVTGPRREVGR
jgi:hypothetical protein